MNNKYVLELKRWYGEEAHKKGLVQLKDYLDKQNLNKGYLVIFDFTEDKAKHWNSKRSVVDGKEIFMIRI